MSKHTPGPWHDGSTPDLKGARIVKREGGGQTIVAECAKRDARLIAEAPMMYAAIMDVLQLQLLSATTGEIVAAITRLSNVVDRVKR